MPPFSSQPATLLMAGAATAEITPPGSVFLVGYPHAPRLSTGVHDPLECAALYLKRGDRHALFLANDVIFVSKAHTAELRRRIQERTGIPGEAVMLTATHTHSGPVMVDYVSNGSDPVVPKADPAYLDFFTERVVAAAESAVHAARPAELGFAVASAAGVGTNRHDPAGPADPEVPLVLARLAGGGRLIGCMIVCAMHPTVLHEDSTLLSADFPYFIRRYLRQQSWCGACHVLFHQGASGNQSPRHVTRANTFAEAQRLGEILGRNVAEILPVIAFQRDVELRVRRTKIDLVPREFPPADVAVQRVMQARARFAELQEKGASRQIVRTAECDVFGAEETAELARAVVDGRLAAAIGACMPAEIQAITLGPWTFVGWPGEFFVEFALEVRKRAPGTFIITMANGELQGYIVTEAAAEREVYESTNAVFAPANGHLVVDATLALIASSP